MKRVLRNTVLAHVAAFAAGEAGATPRGETIVPEPQTAEMIEAQHQQMAQDMAAWLPRLVGRFTFEGVVDFLNSDQSSEGGGGGGTASGSGTSSGGDGGSGGAPGGGGESDYSFEPLPNVRPVKGKGDCIAVGSGAGVQCVIHAVWDEEWTTQGQAVEGGVSFLGPAALLYGLDPNAAKIRYLMLNTNGIAESETGPLNGYAVRWVFETHCERDTMGSCRQIIRLRAAPDSKFIQATIEIEQGINGRWDLVTSINFDMRRIPSAEWPDASKASPERP